MRVRYGKPIKVSNCYPYTKSVTIFPRSGTTTNSYLEVVHYDDTKVFSNVQDNLNHLYFFYAEINGNTSTLRNDILLGSNSLKQQSRYVDENKFCAVAKLTSVGVTSVFFYINGNQQIGDFTVLFHCGVDLTEAFGSGKEPTAQEFYNKYNKYFPLIATGEEITIDDKAGQISISRLPSEYQEVEYIQSQGEQWIDTGYQVSPNYNYRLEAKAQTTVDTYLNFFATFGYENTSGGLLGFGSSNSYNNFCAFFYAINGIESNVARDFNAHTYKARYNKLVSNSLYLDVDNTGEVSYSNSAFNTYSYSTNNLTLLGVPQANTGFHKNKLYYFKLWDSENLVHNFIPCYNKYTNDIGLYDLCSSRKNLCFRNSLSKYNYSYDYLKYNSNNAIYLEAGTYTLSYDSLNGVYIQAFAPNDTSTNVLVTTAFSNCSVPSGSVGNAWNNNALNVSSDGPLTFTLTNNYIITICGRDSSENYTVTNIQIERGTTATTYEHSAFYINSGTGTFLKGNNVNNTISCKVAGGSSDIYYGYNQKVNSVTGGNTGGNVADKTYDEANNEFTLTANSTTPSRSYFGLSCNNLSSLQSHRVLCIAKVTAISITNSFSDISFSWALGGSTITDRNNVTTAGNWVYAIGTWGASTTANYLNVNGATPVEGDYFKVKDVQIIDLTDWFGAGKEPSTVQEFKEKFTKDYYGFCSTPIKLTRYQIEALPSYGYNQLCIATRNSTDMAGIYYTKNSDDTFMLNGTAIRNDSYYINSDTNIPSGHKFLLKSFVGSSSTTLYMSYDGKYDYAGEGSIYTRSGTDNRIILNIKNGASISNTLCKVMLIDLTDWYGSGNEPTTVEEFKATFPNLYYPYSKKRLLNKYMINKLKN